MPIHDPSLGMPLATALVIAGFLSGVSHGADESSPDASAAATITDAFGVHGQLTYVDQQSSGFHSPYRGKNSLLPGRGAETTDATLYLGARLGWGAEVWINPEIDEGFGLDDTTGAAGFPSGEAYKVGKNAPYFRMPRLFIRDTQNLEGDRETVDAVANQLGAVQSVNRWVLWAGKFGVGDIFDVNQYAHDPRADFLNWSAIDAGTFDYAADAWGFTVGAAAEWYQGPWTLRAGIFDLSDVPNSVHLEPAFHEFQTIYEIEHRHDWASHSGKIMLTVFDSRGRMGLLRDAVQLAETTGVVDIAAVRRYRSRWGADLNLEQRICANVGLFARAGKAAGNVETYEFTDIDRTLSVGLSINGAAWFRAHDTLGIAAIRNGISAAREQYLNAGGLGVLVGDGQLPHPGPENIAETYYTVALVPQVHLTLDYQWIDHPAYNTDRGPVSVISVRAHAQF